MSHVYSFLFMLLCATSVGAQKLVLSAEGFRSPEDNTESEATFHTNVNQEEAYRLCVINTTKPGNVHLSVERVKNKQLTIYGFTESTKYLLFGTKELRFVITLKFSSYNYISANAIVTNLKGKEVKYKKLFSSKTGKAKFNIVKTELEDCINETLHALIAGAVTFNND